MYRIKFIARAIHTYSYLENCTFKIILPKSEAMNEVLGARLGAN